MCPFCIINSSSTHVSSVVRSLANRFYDHSNTQHTKQLSSHLAFGRHPKASAASNGFGIPHSPHEDFSAFRIASHHGGMKLPGSSKRIQLLTVGSVRRGVSTSLKSTHCASTSGLILKRPQHDQQSRTRKSSVQPTPFATLFFPFQTLNKLKHFLKMKLKHSRRLFFFCGLHSRRLYG